jgi:hypothetical protein
MAMTETIANPYPNEERFLDKVDIDSGAHIWDGDWYYYRSDFVRRLLKEYSDERRSVAVEALRDYDATLEALLATIRPGEKIMPRTHEWLQEERRRMKEKAGKV